MSFILIIFLLHNQFFFFSFFFFFQLFMLTGAFSILEKVFNIFVILRIFDYSSLDYLDLVVSLQGVLLFVMTVLRKEVLHSLRDR